MSGRRLYFLTVGFYSVLALSALASGITSWDEETDYLGIRTQIAHAARFLNGDSPDYRDIHSDLEYYGIVGLFPAWLLWFIQQAFLVGRISLPQALFYPAAEHQLTGFYFTSHLILFVEFLTLSFVVVLIARELGARYPWLAGSFVLLIPSLVGHSFVNAKDIPFVLFYTVYTFTLIKRFKYAHIHWVYLSQLIAALLINQKFVAIAPVIVTEVVFIFTRKISRDSLLLSLSVPTVGLALALILQPSSWGLWPWTYLKEAFTTFSLHSWGGCMWWGGSCVGIHHSDWSTLRYLQNWWSIKIPLIILFLSLIELASFAHRVYQAPNTFTLRSSWIFLLAQTALIPVMAIIRQSNLYDADRHTLFIYPGLAVLATFGFQRISEIKFCRIWRQSCLLVTAVLAFSLLADTLLLHPYQSAYLNEVGRLTHNHNTTSLDYWAVSAKESLRQAQLNGTLPLSPTVDDSVGPLPLFIGLRQLSGHVVTDASPKLKFQVRDASSFESLSSCNQSSEVSRTLLTGHRLVMSRLWSCP